MKLILEENSKKFAESAADIICGEIKKNPRMVLGIASGRTMIPVYKEIIRRFRKKQVDFSRVKVFQLDEYVDAPKGRMMKTFIQKRFLNKINLNKKNIYLLDLDDGISDYESKILKCGGIDLQILGIGRNGHIGFNEPGSSFESSTRRIKLSEMTKKDNKIEYDYAVTMGIKTIMKAKKIILLASGEHKADVIARAVNGKMSESVPASVLQKHRDVVFIVDKKAGKNL